MEAAANDKVGTRLRRKVRWSERAKSRSLSVSQRANLFCLVHSRFGSASTLVAGDAADAAGDAADATGHAATTAMAESTELYDAVSR